MYIHVSGSPRKGEYSGLTNFQKCHLRQDKLKEKSSDSMLKEKIKKRKRRANIRKDPVKHKKYKEDKKLRKWAAKKKKQANAQMITPQLNGENSSATKNSTPNSRSSFSVV